MADYTINDVDRYSKILEALILVEELDNDEFHQTYRELI
jgi:hypothetical protein